MDWQVASFLIRRRISIDDVFAVVNSVLLDSKADDHDTYTNSMLSIIHQGDPEAFNCFFR